MHQPPTAAQPIPLLCARAWLSRGSAREWCVGGQVSELARDASGKRYQNRAHVAAAEAWCMGVVPALRPAVFGLPDGWLPPAYNPGTQTVFTMKRRDKFDPKDKHVVITLPHPKTLRPATFVIEVGPNEPLEQVARDFMTEALGAGAEKVHGSESHAQALERLFGGEHGLVAHIAEAVRLHDEKVVLQMGGKGA